MKEFQAGYEHNSKTIYAGVIDFKQPFHPVSLWFTVTEAQQFIDAITAALKDAKTYDSKT